MTTTMQTLLDRIQNRYETGWQAGYEAGYQAACRELTAALDLTALDLDDELKPTKSEPKPAIEAELIEASIIPGRASPPVNLDHAELTPKQAFALAHVQRHPGVSAWGHTVSSSVFYKLVERGLLEKRGTQLYPLNSVS